MKDFKSWGIKSRKFPENNYNAVWFNLKTIRLGEGQATELPPEYSEFYDIGINTKCNAECPFCYVSAGRGGVNYPNICETWIKWMNLYREKSYKGITVTNKPYQIATGSTGEPTLHPDFSKFLRTVYDTHVVPNYTTNGIILSKYGSNNYTAESVMEATKFFVGGVAVSFSNLLIRNEAEKAVENLIKYGDTNVNIHHIISTKESVDNFVRAWKFYGDDVLYHVLLPLMPSGRSTKGVEEGVFEYLEEQILINSMKNVSFGAHFYKDLKRSKIKTYLYEPESFSKNVILTPNKVQITPSSFDLNPIKIINL